MHLFYISAEATSILSYINLKLSFTDDFFLSRLLDQLFRICVRWQSASHIFHNIQTFADS